jgi:elongation factor Ts
MNQKEIIEKVKKIREETGLSIMAIKSAVEEAKGDEDKAKEILKKKGLEKAEKREEKETKQGVVASYTHSTGKIGVLVELLCETDFVAKNEDFVALARDLCLQVAAMDPKDAKELSKQEFIKDPSSKVGDLVKGLTAKFGENIKLGKIARIAI